MISNGEVGGAKVSNTGLNLNDHSIKIGWLKAEKGIIMRKEMKGVKRLTFRPSDKGATKRFEKAWGRIHDSRLKEMSMEDIVKENMGIVVRIMKNRNTKVNPNGWSPISRLISLRISVHGTARRMKDRIDYVKIMKARVEELKRSEEELVLNVNEIGWLRDNGLYERPVDWQEWKLLFGGSKYNDEQMNRLRKLNCGRRRRELRLLHSSRMERIQADADAGKIGGVIRDIINRKGGYKMEAIVNEGVCTKDPKEVTNIATDWFMDWFRRSDEDKKRDISLTGMMERDEEEEFVSRATEMKMPKEAIKHVWEGFKKKEINDIGKKEAEELEVYVPTLEEFKEYIKKMNPHSTGGISGLTYFMVQKWDDRVKERVYDELKEKYINKEIPKGWGDCLLAPIPKVVDPTLSDLRPLMLFEVLRKIWTGVIMKKIKGF
jgi:hypothetical protein